MISDDHKGIKSAASKSFIGSSWQLCSIHVKRNLIKIVPKKDLEEVLSYFDDVLCAKDRTTDRNQMIAITCLFLELGDSISIFE